MMNLSGVIKNTSRLLFKCVRIVQTIVIPVMVQKDAKIKSTTVMLSGCGLSVEKYSAMLARKTVVKIDIG